MKIYVVVDALDEPYAVRYSMASALEAVRASLRYLDGAATCGHPSGPGWVAQRLPLRIEYVETQQRLDWLLGDVTPVLEREP